MRKPKTKTLYVYKEYNDTLAYGEEIILLFPEKKDAEEMLKHRVEDYFDESFEDIVNLYNEDEWSDTVEPDYVSIVKDQKGCCFWIVEPHETEISYDDALTTSVCGKPLTSVMWRNAKKN